MEIETPKTWITIERDSDFSYHNIPFGVFSTADHPEDARPASRVGNYLNANIISL